jgi:hypothetical protein
LPLEVRAQGARQEAELVERRVVRHFAEFGWMLIMGFAAQSQ